MLPIKYDILNINSNPIFVYKTGNFVVVWF